MAISIDYQSPAIQPVYQPFFFQVQSSNYTQPQFRFIFDVYKDGVLSERIKMLPRPGTNIAQFSPARILESYLSYDNPYQVSINQLQTNLMCHYTVKYGEEYGAITAAPVVYPNLAQSSGYTFNGTVQYKDYYYSEAGSIFSQFYLKIMSLYNGVGKFLTYAPTGQTIGTNDEHTLSCFNFMTTDVSDANVKRATVISITSYQTSGGSIESKYGFAANSGTTITSKELTWPAGPKNINAMPFGNYISGNFPAINTSTDYKYEVCLYDDGGDRISEKRTFTFQDCSKYSQVRLMFLNRLGGWDYFNFTLVSRDSINSNKTTFKKNLPISYYYGTSTMNRESTVINTSNGKTKKATSNWVTDEESVWLEELWTSPEVYEVTDDPLYTGNKQLIPVVVTTTYQEIKKRINDQIYNYEVEIKYASEVNVQRG
jgi:hypothetical protein